MAYIFDGISLQNKRDTNMDSIMLAQRRLDGINLYLGAVCDGVGSLEDGGFAASEAVRYLKCWFDTLPDARRMGIRLLEAVGEADRTILEKAKQMRMKTATTLSALLLEADGMESSRFYIVHAGDSRIYSYRDGVVSQLTVDQSSNGKLTSYIGRYGRTKLFYEEHEPNGELFLLCSDGLYKRMDIKVMAEELAKVREKGLQKTMKRLAQYVIDRGERDNISIALLMEEE